MGTCRLTYRRDGRPFSILMDKQMEWPILLIDRGRRHLAVVLRWSWWVDDARFVGGFTEGCFILDGLGRPYTIEPIRKVYGGPGIVTKALTIEPCLEELAAFYRESCERAGRKPANLDHVRSVCEFVEAVLASRGYSI